MSRQNKVNPGMYTQRGRLSQDDAARELRKQSVMASPHTWQPVHTQMRQRLAPAGDGHSRDGDVCRQRSKSCEGEETRGTPKGAPYIEESDIERSGQSGFIECQGESRKGEDDRHPQIEEHAR